VAQHFIPMLPLGLEENRTHLAIPSLNCKTRMRPPFSFQALDFGTLMEEDAIVRYEGGPVIYIRFKNNYKRSWTLYFLSQILRR
jgi:hypothetical protein